jgi:hypothetical protein
MRRREFLKYSAVTALAGSVGYTQADAAPVKVAAIGAKAGPLAPGATITHLPPNKLRDPSGRPIVSVAASTENRPQDYETYDLGDVRLQRGATLRGCKLAYKTFGKLNAAKDNAIVYPTWYSGQHYENEWLVGSGMALDPANYFIIIPNMLGNG